MGWRRRSADDEFDDLYGEADDFEYGESGAGEPRFGDDAFYDEPARRRGPVRKTLGCILPLALIGGIVYGGWAAYQHLINNFGSPNCKVVAGGFDYQWSPEQTANAATIVAVGTIKLGMPARAADVAVTTAITESKLRNLTYGDLDSIGLFQQRPSQGWGSSTQIQDPVFASTSFYHALSKVSGWQQLSEARAAQDVQKSGFPGAYEAHTTQAQTLTKALSGQAPQALGCRLDQATSGASPAAFRAKLEKQTGVNAQTGPASVTYRASSARTASAVAAWAIAQAEFDGVTSVTTGDRAWLRQRGRDGWQWHAAPTPTPSPKVVRIDLAPATHTG